MKKYLINVKIEKEDRKMITELQQDYHINISSLVRKLIQNFYNSLKNDINKTSISV